MCELRNNWSDRFPDESEAEGERTAYYFGVEAGVWPFEGRSLWGAAGDRGAASRLWAEGSETAVSCDHSGLHGGVEEYHG